jgi:DMATS type aromatic prenyltransferase
MRSSDLSLADHVGRRLATLCDLCDFGQDGKRVVDTFRELVAPWADRSVGLSSPWRSEIADDHTPIELSVTFADGEPQVRILFEPQGAEPTLSSYREAALALHRSLAQRFDVDLSRFELVRELFLPERAEGAFALWSSVVFSRGKPPSFKAYFNPQAAGRHQAPALVEEALCRLGLRRAWPAVARYATCRGPRLDELKYFSLDLSRDEHARVKVYVQHHGVSAAELEHACLGSAEMCRGQALAFVRAMRGGDEAMRVRSPFTCHAFVAERDERAAAVTVYVPVAAYARDDDAIRARVADYLASARLDPQTYETMLRGYADRPLSDGIGLQSWVALRRYQGSTRITVYLATEATHVFAPGSVPAPTPDRFKLEDPLAVLRAMALHSLADHPFVRRLRRERSSVALRALIANLYEGTRHCARWLAAITAEESDLQRSHGVRVGKLVAALAALADGTVDTTIGRRLGDELAEHSTARDRAESVAALLAWEIAAHELIDAIAAAASTLERVPDPAALESLRFQGQLVDSQAEEPFMLAQTIPTHVTDSVARGAFGVHHALWVALDELYALCFAARASPRLAGSREHAPHDSLRGPTANRG